MCADKNNINNNLRSAGCIPLNGVSCRLVLLWLMMTMLPVAAGAERQGIEAVQYLLTESAALPNADAHWRSTTLPFSTRLEPLSPEAEISTYVWFRFVLMETEDKQLHALLLQRLNLSAQIYFNGQHIGGNQEREGRTAVSWNRPLLITIQPPVWQQGENEVLIRLTRSPWGGNLALVLFGPFAELHELYKARLLRQVEINKVLLVFGLILALVTFIVWLSRRDDPVYLWFSGLALSWSVITTHMIIYFISLPYSVWLPLVHIAIDACILCLYGFVGCVSGVRVVWQEKLLIAWTVLAALVHFLVPSEWFFVTAYIIHLIGVAIVGFIIARAIFKAVRTRDRTTIIISAAVGLQIILFVYNVLLMFFDSNERWEESIFFAHFGIPVLLTVFGAVLLNRLVSALNEAEALNSELGQKVEASRVIIEQQYAEQRMFELNQAAVQERLKIYRDLHDDVGSRLLTIIHSDNNGKLGDTARAALESLRQAVSRANTSAQPIKTFLNEAREETELRLIGSGHEVIWNQSLELPDIVLASEFVFNLNRILKELVSNIIRHAQASLVEVETSHHNGSLYLIVRDNGQGFSESGNKGNGMGNIRIRTHELGGEVKWEDATPGTRVTISIPLPTALNVPIR